MTLMKCISLTALLSGVGIASGDSTDNVSSRLQVHVRYKNASVVTGGKSKFDLELYLALLYLCRFVSFRWPSLFAIISLWRMRHCGYREMHRSSGQFVGNERCRMT